MKIFISLLVALGLLIAGIFAIITCNNGGDDTTAQETEAPPIAASAGKSFTPPAMPAGPQDAESIVIAYNLSDVLEMPSTFRGCWGGQQSRITRQGEDLYVIYGIYNEALGWNDYAGGENDFNLYRYSAAQDKWTYFYTLRSYEIPGIHAAANGNVYVAYVHARGLGILEYNPATDTITLKDSGFHFPQVNDNDHWSYMNTGISGGRYIWFVGNSNTGNHGKPGAFGIYSYDTVTGEFDFGSQMRHVIDYRHCYEYILDDRDGGIIIAGLRDIFWDVCEWDAPAGSIGGAIFDEVNFWTYKDNKLSDIHRVVKASQGKDCPVPSTTFNHGGDAYLDKDGYLHILYIQNGQETGGRGVQYYAVYKDGVEFQKEIFHIKYTEYPVRFAEDTTGQLYVIAMQPDARIVNLFKINKVDGRYEASLSKVLPFEGDDSMAVGFPGMALTVPRTGSAPADYVDLIYPNDPQENFIYLRIQLR